MEELDLNKSNGLPKTPFRGSFQIAFRQAQCNPFVLLAVKTASGERQGLKGQTISAPVWQSERNPDSYRGEPIDEAPKGQDDEQSRWLRLHLQYEHR